MVTGNKLRRASDKPLKFVPKTKEPEHYSLKLSGKAARPRKPFWNNVKRWSTQAETHDNKFGWERCCLRTGMRIKR